jgi:glyoxylase-like metal-dependent hydrolase (beta-lactamase superfamily II)
MTIEIIPITNRGVNCYLLKDNNNLALVDTGFASNRKELIKLLEKEDINKLRIIILTTKPKFIRIKNQFHTLYSKLTSA